MSAEGPPESITDVQPIADLLNHLVNQVRELAVVRPAELLPGL